MATGIMLWLAASLTISCVAFAMGLVTVGGIGGLALPNQTYHALYLGSMIFSLAWLLTVAVAVIVHRWRGLWLLIGAPFALFWPTFVVGFALAISHCMAIKDAKFCMP